MMWDHSWDSLNKSRKLDSRWLLSKSVDPFGVYSRIAHRAKPQLKSRVVCCPGVYIFVLWINNNPINGICYSTQVTCQIGYLI